MLTRLVASGGERRRTWNLRTAIVSIVLHAALLGGAVYASVNAAPVVVERIEEEVTFLEHPEADPVPEEAPPPEIEEPPPAPEPTADVPPPPGFQELIPPSVTPSELPPVNMDLAVVRPEDFSGIGQAGGIARGVEGGTPTNVVPDSAPKQVFAVEETGVTPELTNLREIQRVLSTNYPRQFADARIPGDAHIRFMIDENGRVPANSVTVINASHDAFGEAAQKSATRLRFRPISYRGEHVRVWATMPITFQPPR